MLKNIYKWHRTTSLIIAIPVVLWALSGFMHPIMTTIRPKVATQFLIPKAIQEKKILIKIDSVLRANQIQTIHRFRVVSIDTNFFYQVQKTVNATPIYFSTQNGKLLAEGDWLYAQYLAKKFLKGEKDSKAKQAVNNVQLETADDCCSSAALCALDTSGGAEVNNVSLIKSFNSEYKNINKLLPVYSVSFKRTDGVRIYVQTSSDRFAYAVDDKRATFDTFFQLFHNWSWLSFLGSGRLIFEVVIMFLAFSTTILGLYIFFKTSSKKVEGNEKIKARRNHRYSAVLISLFTLLFTFSGGYHALDKIIEREKIALIRNEVIPVTNLAMPFDMIQSIVKKPITKWSVIEMNGVIYWQINTRNTISGNKVMPKEGGQKDKMKDKVVPPPSAIYVNTQTGKILQNGEEVYAKHLATKYSGRPTAEINNVSVITKFEGEYGFINKRLPVHKVAYSQNHNERFYVETATGEYATTVNDRDLWEGYSFAMLHKHHFMDFGGKSIRDFSTMFWAMAQIAMVTIGLMLFFKTRKKGAVRES